MNLYLSVHMFILQKYTVSENGNFRRPVEAAQKINVPDDAASDSDTKIFDNAQQVHIDDVPKYATAVRYLFFLSICISFLSILTQQKEAKLDAIIARNYYPDRYALDLTGAVKGFDLLDVLDRIEIFAYYEDIDHLILRNNEFETRFNSDAIRSRFKIPSVKDLDLSNNKLAGTRFPFDALPPTLETLCLQNNDFWGRIDWYLLPRSLKISWLHGNGFNNAIEWNMLPIDLEVLGVSKFVADASFVLMDSKWTREEIEWGHQALFTKQDFIKVHNGHNNSSP